MFNTFPFFIIFLSMEIIDFTHTIEPGMPVYPGTEPPVIVRTNTIEQDGFLEHRITMFSHTGTHMDAPSHILINGSTLNTYHAEYFIGTASILDIRNMTGREIRKELIVQYEDVINGVDFLIFNTGWSEHWREDTYFSGYPVLDPDAAIYLSELNRLRGIGIDAISFDSETGNDFPVHNILLGAGKLLIENLTNLVNAGQNKFRFICLPLKTQDADGAPVRAVAIIE
jgi:arylformamidase